MATSGFRKTAFYLGIGCLGVPIVLAILVALFLYAARGAMRSHGPAKTEPASLSIPIERAASESSSQGSQDSGAAGPAVVPGRDLEEMAQAAGASYKPLRLDLDLSEGHFIILPGPPGSDLKVEGEFDPRDYELTQETEDLGEEGRQVSIRFRGKSFFRLFFNRGRNPNRLTIHIPQEVPTALHLRLGKCQSDIDLGGLRLTELEARLHMGEHEVGFSRPIAGELPRARFHTGMGQIHLNNLGNARAREYYLKGSMGEFRADFDGEWLPGFQSKAECRFSMGDMVVRVPRGVRLSKDSRARVALGEARTVRSEEEPEDPNAPILQVNASASMGEIRVIQE